MSCGKTSEVSGKIRPAMNCSEDIEDIVAEESSSVEPCWKDGANETD